MPEIAGASMTMDTEATAPVVDSIYRKLAWRLIPFLMLCYSVSYLDRVNIGFAKLQMLGDLGFSNTMYGFGAGIFFIGYTLFGPLANLALHRLGGKIWIAAIMIAWGVLAGLTSFVRTPAQFFLLRFVLGAAEAGFVPAVMLYLTFWFPGSRRARMVSFFYAALPLAGVVGGPLSGWILDHLNGPLHLRGWQWLFLIEAIPATLLGIIAWFYLDNGIATARWLTASEKEHLAIIMANERSQKEVRPVLASLTDNRIWRLGVLSVGLAMGIYAVSFWMPTLLKDAGAGSATTIGWISAIPNLAAIPAMIFFAHRSDKKRERRWHVAIPAVIGASGLLLGAVCTQHLILAIIALSVAMVGLMSEIAPNWSMVTAFTGGAGGAAAIGLVNSIANCGGLISPTLMGWLKDTTGSLELALIAVGLCASASVILALSMPARLVNK